MLGSYSAIHQGIFDETISDEKFKCESCGLNFYTQENLEEHLNQHERAMELFRCDKYKMSFQSKEDLEKHVRELHGSSRSQR